MLRSLLLPLLLCVSAVAQSTDYRIVYATRSNGGLVSSWSNDIADGDSLTQMAFGVRYAGPGAAPQGVRAAIFARIEAPAGSGMQAAVNTQWPNGGIDLSPLAGAAPAYPSAQLTQDPTSLNSSVAISSMSAYLAACAANPPVVGAVPSGSGTQGVPLLNPTPAAFGGSSGFAWPATRSGWTVPSFNSLVWTPSYDSKVVDTGTPGGVLTTFNLGRLIERLVLLQSTSATDARAFLQSVLYNHTISNQFVLKLQACVILPGVQTPNGPRTPFYLTPVFESYIHLIPGDAGIPGYVPHEQGCVNVTLTSTFASRASVIFDGGTGGPVVLSIGNANVPTAIHFDTGNCVVSTGYMLNPLFPGDPFCPYWFAFRLPGISGPVTKIELAPRLATPFPFEPGPLGPADVFVLPPRTDSAPMFTLEPGQQWWDLLSILPLYL